MNYELAKELRDAGFEHLHGAGCYEFETDTCLPTLSELIEACGNIGFQLTHDARGFWQAQSYLHAVSVKGATPEEAVARLWLWLALNKKP